MKGRQPGRPTKWVSASVLQLIDIGKSGIQLEVWEKWKRTRRKVGTLTVSVGGLRWRPPSGKLLRQKSWDEFAQWFTPPD
jgi:hypothetical protein